MLGNNFQQLSENIAEDVWNLHYKTDEEILEMMDFYRKHHGTIGATMS